MIIEVEIRERKVWRNAIFALTIILLSIFVLYLSTFIGMVSIWERSETFTHGFLVLPITLWLIWRKRTLLALRQPKPDFLLIIPIFLTSLIWLLGDLVAINSVTQLAVICLIVLSVFAVLGWSVTSVIIFPLGFLFFAVPLGEFLLPLLMEWTAKFTVVAIRLSGIPVYQEGLQFVISSGNWSVVEACSGVRYLISSLMIGTLYAYLNYKSLSRRIIFICVSIVVPVLANWLRAYFIVMLGHFSGNKLAVGFDHIIYGWVFFGVVIFLMFLIGGRWAENTGLDNFTGSRIKLDVNLKVTKFWCLSLLAAVTVSIPVIWIRHISEARNLKPPIFGFPNEFSSGWSKSNHKLIESKPSFHGSAADINNSYVKNSSYVGLYVAYYRNQNYENKLISSSNSIFSNEHKEWQVLNSEDYVVADLNNNMVVRLMNWRTLGSYDQVAGIRLQTWQVYWVDGVFTQSDYKAKIYGAVQRLFGRGDDSALVVLYAINGEDGLAKVSIEEFLKNNYSEIKKALEKTRDE